jgi:hypothetical protein
VVDDDAVSWRAIVYGTPVIASDGGRCGTVVEVLGDDAEDIFHGVRVQLDAGKRDVVISAEDIASLSHAAIQVTLTAAEIAGQTDYQEAATYHVGQVGGFRKHLGWKQDSKSDEEPG